MEASESTTEKCCVRSWRNSKNHSKHGDYMSYGNKLKCHRNGSKKSKFKDKPTSSSEETKLITSISAEYCHNNLNCECKNRV